MRTIPTPRSLARAAAILLAVGAAATAPAVAQAAPADVLVEMTAPAAAATGDVVTATVVVTNPTDSIRTVTVRLGEMDPGTEAVVPTRRLWPQNRYASTCPAEGCTASLLPGAVFRWYVRNAVADAGTARSAVEVLVEGAPDPVPASADTEVSGDACTVLGTLSSDVLAGSDPAGDVVCGFGGGDVLIPGPGPDLLLAGPDANTLDLRQSVAAPTSSGWIVDSSQSTGTAVLRGRAGVVVRYRGISAIIGGIGDDRITGGVRWESLDGGPGNDRIDAGPGDDYLTGGRGDDVLIGGPGTDTLRYIPHVNTVRVFLSTNAPQQTGGAGVDTISTTVENVVGTGGSDLLVGSERANTLVGNGGDDRLVGRGGDDYLTGHAGADRYDGGTGTDVCKDRDAGTVRTACERFG